MVDIRSNECSTWWKFHSEILGQTISGSNVDWYRKHGAFNQFVFPRVPPQSYLCTLFRVFSFLIYFNEYFATCNLYSDACFRISKILNSKLNNLQKELPFVSTEFERNLSCLSCWSSVETAVAIPKKNMKFGGLIEISIFCSANCS